VGARRDATTRISRSSCIAADRAEILGLIDKLSSVRKERASRRPVAPPAELTGMSRAAMLALVRSLEVRVTMLEERQVRSARKSSLPAPANGQPEVKYTFSGFIQGQMLSDMLQLVSSNNMSGKFVVKNEHQQSTLYFEQGRVCHGVAGDLEGEQAFFAAFAFESGVYHFEETAELPEDRTVNSSTQFLILEALRQIDESHGP
jgi:hypothetical protein